MVLPGRATVGLGELDAAADDVIDRTDMAAIRADGSYNVIYKKWFNQDYKPQ